MGAKTAAKINGALGDAERYLLPTYKRSSTVFTHGRDCWVYDSTGNPIAEIDKGDVALPFLLDTVWRQPFGR